MSERFHLALSSLTKLPAAAQIPENSAGRVGGQAASVEGQASVSRRMSSYYGGRRVVAGRTDLGAIHLNDTRDRYAIPSVVAAW